VKQRREKLALPLCIDTHAFIVTNTGIVIDHNYEGVAEFDTIDEAEVFVANANGMAVATLRRQMVDRHRMMDEYSRNLRRGKAPTEI
jgi:hypothetical protein